MEKLGCQVNFCLAAGIEVEGQVLRSQKWIVHESDWAALFHLCLEIATCFLLVSCYKV